MIDFVKYRTLSATWFFLLIGTFIGGYIYKTMTRGYAFVYSVDFTGGTQVVLDFSKPVSSENIIKILEKNNLSATTREFSQNMGSAEFNLRKQ